MEWHIYFVSEFLKKVARQTTYPIVSGTTSIVEGLVLCLIFCSHSAKV